MQMRKVRSARAGSNGASRADRRCNCASASRTGPINASARGVGCMPAGVRTNSGSSRRLRKRASQMLTVGWLWPSSSAACVTLRVRCSRSSRRSSLGSNRASSGGGHASYCDSQCRPIARITLRGRRSRRLSLHATMKIHVLGAGSLGCAIGGTLAAAGSEVTLIARSREHVDAVNASGLVMRDADGNERLVEARRRDRRRGPVAGRPGDRAGEVVPHRSGDRGLQAGGRRQHDRDVAAERARPRRGARQRRRPRSGCSPARPMSAACSSRPASCAPACKAS